MKRKGDEGMDDGWSKGFSVIIGVEKTKRWEKALIHFSPRGWSFLVVSFCSLIQEFSSSPMMSNTYFYVMRMHSK